MDERFKDFLEKFDRLGKINKEEMYADIEELIERFTELKPKKPNKQQVKKDWARTLWRPKYIKFFPLHEVLTKVRSYEILEDRIVIYIHDFKRIREFHLPNDRLKQFSPNNLFMSKITMYSDTHLETEIDGKTISVPRVLENICYEVTTNDNK